MAKRTVVVIRLLVLWDGRKSVMRFSRQQCRSKRRMPMVGRCSCLRLRRGVGGEVAARCNPTPKPSPRAGRRDERRYHVLMLVVREFNSELPLVFGLRRLVRAIRFAESETAIFTRRGAEVTHSADCGTGAAHRL